MISAKAVAVLFRKWSSRRESKPMFKEELNIKILNSNEELLGILHPNYVSVIEVEEYRGLRRLTITHPLQDDANKDLSHYTQLLTHGNKVWRETTGNGDSCLYVLLEDKLVDTVSNTIKITAEEVATELSMMPPKRLNTKTPKTVDSAFLTEILGTQFTPGTITTGQTFTYSGTIGIMDLLREIEDQTSHEFRFRYEYNPTEDVIHRYIDLLPQVGKEIAEPIMVGYNTENIIYEETEEDVAIAAAPCGKPSDSKDEANDNFHDSRKAFEDLVVDPSVRIPLWVIKKEDGEEGELEEGPLAYPPYPKAAGTTYVASDGSESTANYKVIRKKEKGATTIPRTVLFESSEEHPINLYWLCVGKIREKQQGQIQIDTTPVDIRQLKGYTPTYFNVGDTVPVQLPGSDVRVASRVIRTEKNPRSVADNRVELGNYCLDFFGGYQPRNMPFSDIPSF